MPLSFSNILAADELRRMSEIIEENAGQGVRAISRKVRDELKSSFPVGHVVYADGSKHSLVEYSEMLVSTSLVDAEREAVRNFITNNPTDLVQISINGSVHPGCAMFEGEIFSVSGLNPHFRPLDSAMGPGLLFHPRCQHTMVPVYNDGLDSDKELRESNMRTILNNQAAVAAYFSSTQKAEDFLTRQERILAPRFKEEFKLKETEDGEAILTSSLTLTSTGETVSIRHTVVFIDDEDEITDSELERISGQRTSLSLQ